MRANRKGVAARRGLKEAGSDSRGSMDKNRMEVPARRDRRTSGRLAAKSVSIKGGGCRFGGRAAKAVELTSGGLRRAVVEVTAAESVARRADRVGEVSRGHSNPRRRMKAQTVGVVSRTYVS